MARLAPVAEPWSAEVAAALANYPSRQGYLLSLFRTFANSLRFLRKGVPNLLDRDSPLPLRWRELVILRVTARRGCEYEWGVHVAIFAMAAKLTAAEVAASCGPLVPADWPDADAILLAAVDALLDHGRMDDALQLRFEATFSLDQQLEIMALAGAYQTISLVANTARLPPEPFAARFPG